MTPPGPRGSFVELLEVIVEHAGGVAELARVTKVSPTTLARWRRGEFPNSRISGTVEAVNSWARANMADYPPAPYHPSGLLAYVRPRDINDPAERVPQPDTAGSSENSESENSELCENGGSGPPKRRRMGPVLAALLVLLLGAGFVVYALGLLDSPVGRVVTVQNKIATGSSDLLEDRSSSYLSSAPQARCVEQGCKIPGTDLTTGARLTATCRTLGATLTNADRTSPGIASNPGAVTSSVWLYASNSEGVQGFISVIYLVPGDRQPDELPLC